MAQDDSSESQTCAECNGPPSANTPQYPARKLVDSIAELTASDAGCLAISGSHGGLSAARYALAVRPLLSIFNDAGVGLNRAGIAGLVQLDANGLAACTVSHHSACIGVAQSTWDTGVISHANSQAMALGVRPGMRVSALVMAIEGAAA